MSTTHELIRTLRDVEGVAGSFLIGYGGEIISYDMPAYFDLQTLTDVSPRLLRLFEVWSLDPAGAECVLRFSESRLLLRGCPHAVLCVLLADGVQAGALRAATALVVRGLERGTPGAPGRALAAISDPEAAKGRADAHGGGDRVRLYRGRRYGC